MRVNEITLTNSSPLFIEGQQVGTAERGADASKADFLRIRFSSGSFLELPGGVDISEQLRAPRFFMIKGMSDSRLFIFGGENAYWLSTEGKIENVLKTFRTYADAEYWETKIIERSSDIVIIYEAGVLVVDEALTIKCHKSKLFNDVFSSIEGDSLRLLRDHDTEWQMQLVDGK